MVVHGLTHCIESVICVFELFGIIYEKMKFDSYTLTAHFSLV